MSPVTPPLVGSSTRCKSESTLRTDPSHPPPVHLFGVWSNPRPPLGWAGPPQGPALDPLPHSHPPQPCGAEPLHHAPRALSLGHNVVRWALASEPTGKPGSARLVTSPARLGPARPGLARLGPARPGLARLGPARPGLAWLGPAWPGLARLGPAWPGSARLGTARPGLAPLGSGRLGPLPPWQPPLQNALTARLRGAAGARALAPQEWPTARLLAPPARPPPRARLGVFASTQSSRLLRAASCASFAARRSRDTNLRIVLCERNLPIVSCEIALCEKEVRPRAVEPGAPPALPGLGAACRNSRQCGAAAARAAAAGAEGPGVEGPGGEKE
jgi:hypothetical protein